MKNELHNKILSDLKKAGIASELKTIQTLKEHGWKPSVSASYFDRDNNCSREIDIIALHPYHEEDKKGKDLCSLLRICIEVKKSETPWVVLAPKAGSDGESVMRSNLLTVPPWLTDESHKQFETSDYWMALTEADYTNELGWLGTNIHESFKPPGNQSRWHSSFFTVCKAMQAEYDDWFLEHSRRVGKKPSRIKELYDTHIFLGAVVLDGPLYVARLTSNGDIELDEKVNFAPFDFYLQTSKYQPNYYRIDLVQINSLGSYLDMIKKWHQFYKEMLLRHLNCDEDDTSYMQ